MDLNLSDYRNELSSLLLQLLQLLSKGLGPLAGLSLLTLLTSSEVLQASLLAEARERNSASLHSQSIRIKLNESTYVS